MTTTTHTNNSKFICKYNINLACSITITIFIINFYYYNYHYANDEQTALNNYQLKYCEIKISLEVLGPWKYKTERTLQHSVGWMNG